MVTYDQFKYHSYGEAKNEIIRDISSINKKVQVLCTGLITSTKDILTHKIKMVVNMAKHVTTEQIVQFWNLLKFCLKYLWWLHFGTRIPDTTETVLSEVQAHIDECILDAYATFRIHTVESKTNFILFTNALNAYTEMSLYFHICPELKELLYQKWRNENRQFVQHKLPQQVKKQYETEIEQYTNYAKQEYIDCLDEQRWIAR